MTKKITYSISTTDKWADVEWFVNSNPQAMERLEKAVTAKDDMFDFFGITVKDLCMIIDGQRIPASMLPEGMTVGEYMMRRNSIVAGMEAFAAMLEKTNPPTTATQRMDETGLLDMTAEEGILLTCKNFYGLHSLEDAQKLTVYEYIIARKALYNERKVDYNRYVRLAAGNRGRMPS